MTMLPNSVNGDIKIDIDSNKVESKLNTINREIVGMQISNYLIIFLLFVIGMNTVDRADSPFIFFPIILYVFLKCCCVIRIN